MKVNKYFPFVLVYFFINSWLLPFGLTYMALLAPFFYAWVLLVRKKEILLPFLALLLPFIVMQLMVSDVETKSYLFSFINYLLVYIFCQAVYTFLKTCNDPEKIFRKILAVNFIFCLLAIVLFFTPFAGWVWMNQGISGQRERLVRLKLFTYEPSYYATLFTPLFFFFLLQYLFRQNTVGDKKLLLMLFLPLLLSFSVGVIGAILLAVFITWIFYFRRLTQKRRILNSIINIGAVTGLLLFFILFFFRHHPFLSRLAAIFSGKDSSGKGRTVDAFIIADKILKETNPYWGAGFGQVKVAGEGIIRNYYLYYTDNVVAIPNAAAETLAIFGWNGFILRISVELFLFFGTKVWTNYYRLLLFLFMFIYQFTGSFVTNVAEYVIWILAFTNIFRQFDVKTAGIKRSVMIPQQAG